MTDFYVSGKFITACVTVNKLGTITDAAPAFRVFVGQNIEKLKRWLEKEDGIAPIVKELNNEDLSV